MDYVNMFRLDGKKVLVAGASRGIGLAIAQAAAAQGGRTVLAARSADKLKEHAEELASEGYAAETQSLDMTDNASIDACVSAHPDVDILINVAGTNIRKRFEDYTEAEYEHLMRTNLHGLVRLTQGIGRTMIERGKGGKIVHIGSLMSLLGLPYLSVYAMTKSALAGLTRTLAAEWAEHDIQVNCVAPGFILTDLNREMWQPQHMKQWLAGAQPNPRLGKPSDIAGLSVFLASPAADYITGQVIASDGGYTTTAKWPHAPAE